jgi:membrane-anchored protein YejM (alkaline phosphatase superfamily)
MSSENKTRMDLERVIRLIRRNKLAYHIAGKPYSWYQRRRDKHLFDTRMRSLVDPFIDHSSQPALNVIIITVDALRNSNLSCNGYFRQTTPFLDSIKTRARAISASPWTYPSVASLLTGLYPHNHGAVHKGTAKNVLSDDPNSYVPLTNQVVSLPEIFNFMGYSTHFFTAIILAYLPLKSGINAYQYSAVTPAETLFRGLRKYIRKGKERQFAYVHLADLHIPYAVPYGYNKYFGYDGNSQEEVTIPSQTMYDNALRYVDAEIARLFDYLSDSRLLDRTVVVITGDHGESFREHRDLDSTYFYYPQGFHDMGHGHNVFREIIEVPLMFAGAVRAEGENNLVSLVDVVPSVLDLIGVRHTLRFDGQSVFANIDSIEPRPLLCEACAFGYEKKALIVGSQKLIYSKEDRIEWVFDLENDPLEQNPITDPKITSPMVNRLQMILREDERLRIREAKRRIKSKSNLA